MKKLMLALSMMLFIPAISQASPVIVNNVCTANCPAPVGLQAAVMPLAVLSVAYLAATDKGQACDNEPVRHVTEANKGYSFDVAGCDYEANKAKYIIK